MCRSLTNKQIVTLKSKTGVPVAQWQKWLCTGPRLDIAMVAAKNSQYIHF